MNRDAQRRYRLTESYDFCRVINGGWQLSLSERRRAASTVVDDWSRLVEAGFTTFDVADIYSGVERIAGRVAARFSPGEVQVHTKCVPDRSLLPRLRPTDLEAMIDRSLDRIGVERLDLVQFHWWDFKVDGWIESLHTLNRFREAGKIRHLGVTNFDAGRLGALLDAGLPIRTNQVQYSLLDRRPDGELVTTCRRRGVTLLAYGTLAGGFMGARWIGSRRPRADELSRSLVKYLLIIDECGGWEAQQRRLRVLETVGEKHGVGPAAVAVRWVLERATVGAAIVGASGAGHLEHNERVFGFRLDNSDHQLLERDLPDGLKGEVYGLERESDRHASIMRYELQRSPEG